MSIAITPIGVNVAFTTTGFQTNYLLETQRVSVLVDCGTTAARALAAVGSSLIDIEHVLITHIHMDHVGGLPELGLQRYFAGKTRPRIYIHQSLSNTLWDNFLSGPLAQYVDQKGRNKLATASTFFDVVSLSETCEESDHATVVEDLSLRLVPMEHIPGAPSFGVIVNDRVFLTSDTKFLPELLKELVGKYALEAIFHDCSFREAQRFVHSTYTELCSLPDHIKSRLLLTHYEDNYEDYLKGDKFIALKLAAAGKSYRY